MGTRGFVGVVIDGTVKASYQQYDSYPSGVGVEVLGWLRDSGEFTIDHARKQARDLRMVDENDTPSAEEFEQYASTHQNVSTGEDWYSLLRGNQGDLGAILRTGVATDMADFPIDSLFCEWGYLVDLDAETLEVYEGFQKTLPKEGRWAGRPTAEEDAEAYKQHLADCAENGREPWRPEVSEYKAVERVAVYPLDSLPSDDDFVGKLEPREAE